MGSGACLNRNISYRKHPSYEMPAARVSFATSRTRARARLLLSPRRRARADGAHDRDAQQLRIRPRLAERKVPPLLRCPPAPPAPLRPASAKLTQVARFSAKKILEDSALPFLIDLDLHSKLSLCQHDGFHVAEIRVWVKQDVRQSIIRVQIRRGQTHDARYFRDAIIIRDSIGASPGLLVCTSRSPSQ